MVTAVSNNQVLPDQVLSSDSPSKTKVCGPEASNNTVDFVDRWAQRIRMTKQDFLCLFSSEEKALDDIVRLPAHEFIELAHCKALTENKLADLPPSQRVFIRFTLHNNTSKSGKLYIALPIKESGTDSPDYKPPLLSLDNALVYKATRVIKKLSYENIEQLIEKHELCLEHCSSLISSIDTLKQTIVSRYSKSKQNLNHADILALGVAVVWYEVVGHIDQNTNQICWLPEESVVGSIASQVISTSTGISSDDFVMIGGSKLNIQSVCRLLKIVGITSKPSVSDLQKNLEKNVRRDAGEERSEMAKNERFQALAQRCESKRNELMAEANKLGLLEAICPVQKHFHHILLLGATVQVMEQSMNLLIDSKITCDCLNLLAGLRELREDETVYLTTQYGVLDPITTEAEALETILTGFQKKGHFQNIPKNVIKAEDKIEAGEPRRANTQDTVEDWLKSNPHPTSTLIVSTQPFAPYQNQVVRNVLSDNGYCPDVATLAHVPANLEGYNLILLLNAIDSIFRVYRND